MADTQLLFGDEARHKVLAGATQMADALRVTLGPRSRSVLIGRSWGVPEVCDDGVTIAKQIKLPDAVENLGAQMLRQAAVRTGEAVGDGTTTATLLAHTLFAEGLRNVVAGAHAIDIKRGMDEGTKVAIEALRGLARPVATKLEKGQVAAVSAHGDLTIGEMVADAIERVGSEGVVSVEEAKTTETSLELVEGLRFDRGYVSPYFVTNPEKMQAELENPLILLSDQKITSMDDLLPVLEPLAKAGRALVIIADDVDGEALATLVLNKLRGALSTIAVKAPGFGDRRKDMLEDIAILTGGQVVSKDLGVTLDKVDIERLGAARRVIVTKDNTTIVGGGGDSTRIGERCDQLRRQLEDTTSDYEREKLQERLAKLAGGIAVIRVGAPTESELKQRKDAYEDAIRSCQAAVAEGVVPGGGVAFLRAVAAVDALTDQREGDLRTGLRILSRALETPTRQLAQNSNKDPGVVVERILAGTGAFGFNAATDEYGDLERAGIIEPLKVVRVALESAVSVAGVLLLAEATCTELPAPDHESAEFGGGAVR